MITSQRPLLLLVKKDCLALYSKMTLLHSSELFYTRGIFYEFFVQFPDPSISQTERFDERGYDRHAIRLVELDNLFADRGDIASSDAELLVHFQVRS